MKKIWGLGLAGIMAFSTIGGCGNQEESAAKNPADDVEKTTVGVSDTEENQDTDTEENQDGIYNVDWDDMAEITVMYLSNTAIPSGLKNVEAAINEITEKEINTHVNLTMVESGNYSQQVGLIMASAEPIDLILTTPIASSTYDTMRTQNQLMDISGLLEDYGQPILENLGDLVKATTVGDAVYAVTGYRNLATSNYILMRSDILEDLGLTEKAENMTTWAEYEEILEAVKNSEKWSTVSGIISSTKGYVVGLSGTILCGDTFGDTRSYDNLGSKDYVSVSLEAGEPKVQLTFDTDEYREMYERVHRWYEKGYVYKDATTTTENAEELVKSGVGFSYIAGGGYGMQEVKSTSAGYDLTCVKISDNPLTTASCTLFSWAVPTVAKEPEAAITFLSMMFSDERIANLLAWGIEGIDYEVVDGEACFIEGNEETAYHTVDFMYGNQFLLKPWDGLGADYYEHCQQEMDNARISPYLGFSADTSSLSSEIAAVTSTLNEYLPQINCGTADEETYNAFIDKLNSVGMQKIIDTYQQQLDAWLENN